MNSATRRRMALAVAALADAIQLGLFPFFSEGFLSLPDAVLDGVTAMLLLAIMGWQPRLVAALIAELVPGLALFPSWTVFVATSPTDALRARTEPRASGGRI